MDNGHVSVWGRTLEEYRSMFVLDNISTSIKVASIADGPSTFNLQLRQIGTQITSIDPIYNLSVEQLKDIFQKSYLFNKNLFKESREVFNFKNELEIEQVLEKRQNTFNEFIVDYEKNKSNYQYGKLPSLALASNSFDLCLCSNFLFIFDHIFNLEFHISSIKEMLRISNEVRIFPLYNIKGKESNYLEPVIDFLDSNHYHYIFETNGYDIWKDGNRLLKITQ